MNDSFDDDLRRSLHSQADGLPRMPDLSRGAISRAHGIRRRRRVAGIAAAAAVVAIAVPIGLRVGDVISNGSGPVDPSTHGPSAVISESAGPVSRVHIPLDLQELSEGGAPGVPYLDGRTVVGDGFTVDVSGGVTAVAPVVDDAYVTGSWDKGWPMTRYAADGTTEDLGTVQALPVASADGHWVAYATGETDESGNQVGPTALTLVDDETGRSSSVEINDASFVTVHAVVDGTVYFTYDTRAGRGVPLQTWSMDDASPKQVEGDLDATAVSSDGALAGRLTSVRDFGSCSTIVQLTTGAQTPENCDYKYMGFSPDGTYAWAVPSDTEGYAASKLVLVDVVTGSPFRVYDSKSMQHGISFMDATFEDDDTLLVRAEQDGGTALLRCTAEANDCELAAPLTDGTSLGRNPYLLPDGR